MNIASASEEPEQTQPQTDTSGSNSSSAAGKKLDLSTLPTPDQLLKTAEQATLESPAPRSMAGHYSAVIKKLVERDFNPAQIVAFFKKNNIETSNSSVRRQMKKAEKQIRSERAKNSRGKNKKKENTGGNAP